MALDQVQLERLLCERLCAEVKIHRREDDVLMMESPFTFPDGDHFPIYLSETAGGGVRLSDRGHTLMHVSYEHDVELFYDGARASLREQRANRTRERHRGRRGYLLNRDASGPSGGSSVHVWLGADKDP